MASTGAKLFKGGVAFITGAASGIGQATAFRFARHGVAALALSDIRVKHQAEVSARLQDEYPHLEVLTLPIDTSSEESVVKAHKATVKHLGRIDYAINNAGVPGVMKPTPDMTSDEFRRGLDINLTGVWLGQREQIRQMLKQEPRSPE
ncbi:hypothetical protein LTR47_009911 [Exophiala xenobiotica]|nr:hypothetical protein LTR47_009911 [Exophiala xenobiotica]KAK5243936.1 hypothetical protein LTS06_010412 [Exophiala xenobiotica]KAK5282180.1 hypothetical protein LTR40_003662 [Exophiala xenobiotica]KAK5347933.1 hypothetical protein LTR61_008185 [Exophiala xenobiotica]KAK5361458.1 hypothetical protein LTS03_010411 [Exophiala xenobiotica]